MELKAVIFAQEYLTPWDLARRSSVSRSWYRSSWPCQSDLQDIDIPQAGRVITRTEIDRLLKALVVALESPTEESAEKSLRAAIAVRTLSANRYKSATLPVQFLTLSPERLAERFSDPYQLNGIRLIKHEVLLPLVAIYCDESLPRKTRLAAIVSVFTLCRSFSMFVEYDSLIDKVIPALNLALKDTKLSIRQAAIDALFSMTGLDPMVMTKGAGSGTFTLLLDMVQNLPPTYSDEHSSTFRFFDIAFCTLRQLSYVNDGEDAENAGALPIMVNILTTGCTRARVECLEVLYALLLDSPKRLEQFVNLGGSKAIIRLCMELPMHKGYQVGQIIMWLLESNQFRETLIAQGVAGALARLFVTECGFDAALFFCFTALDCIDNRIWRDLIITETIPALARLMLGGRSWCRADAKSLLRRLARRDPYVKASIRTVLLRRPRTRDASELTNP